MTLKLLRHPSPEVNLGKSIQLFGLDTAAGRLYVLADGSGWWDGAGWHVAQAEVPTQFLSPDGRRWWTGVAWAVRPDRSAAAPAAATPAGVTPDAPQGYHHDVAPGAPPSDPVPEERPAATAAPAARRPSVTGSLPPPARRAVVLLSSPLLSPDVWTRTAAVLADRGITAVTLPGDTHELRGMAGSSQDVLAAALGEESGADVALVGHAEAGPLLPAIAARTGVRVAACIVVDAALPRPGASQLDLLDEDAPGVAARVRESLETTGRYPNWSDTDLRVDIPDAYGYSRRLVLDSQQGRPPRFFTEGIAAEEGWWRGPSGLLLLSDAYRGAAEHARRLGWPVRAIANGGHFEMMVRPGTVADALQGLLDQLLSSAPRPFAALDTTRRSAHERDAVRAA